jgi:N-acetylneuraminic acid mutarotase
VSPESMTSGWYYLKLGAPPGQHTGPLSWEDLYALAQSGTLTPADPVWNPQLPQWLPASQFPGLFPAATLAAAPSPYPAAAQPNAQGPAPQPVAAPQPYPTQPRAVYQPYPGQPTGYVPRSRRSRLLKVLVPVIALVLVGAALGIYFGVTRHAGNKPASSLAQFSWRAVESVDGAPMPRAYHSMVYDEAHDQVILFGGWDGIAYVDDTWAYDPVTYTWTDLSPAGELPPARQEHAMCWDSPSGRVVLFGGVTDETGSFLNDTWAYDPVANAWTALNPAGEVPAARVGHSMVQDPDTGSAILFGGIGEDISTYSDTFAYDPATNTWIELEPAGEVPPARYGHSMVYDEARRQVLLFGGYAEDGTRLNDLWAYDPAANTWTELEPTGSLPARRNGSSLVYSSSTGLIILFGGYHGAAWLNDTWAYDPSANTWTELESDWEPPPGRAYHAMVYDSLRDSAIMFGGLTGSDQFPAYNDTWTFEKETP